LENNQGTQMNQQNGRGRKQLSFLIIVAAAELSSGADTMFCMFFIIIIIYLFFLTGQHRGR
jgi:hypothetical protein